jgi:hypothetical protein
VKASGAAASAEVATNSTLAAAVTASAQQRRRRTEVESERIRHYLRLGTNDFAHNPFAARVIELVDGDALRRC